MQTAEAETKKYEEAQQSEQSAFQASIADLSQAVASMQSYTDMSAATTIADEVCIYAKELPVTHRALWSKINPCTNMPPSQIVSMVCDTGITSDTSYSKQLEGFTLALHVCTLLLMIQCMCVHM